MTDPVTLARALLARAGVDPGAALAVARAESGLDPRAVGDNGSSFGLWQLHQGGALPAGKGLDWASSPEGIGYAVNQIASVAKGLHGADAVKAIVQRFERPADPAGEITRALAFHDQMNGGPQKAGQAAGLRAQKGRQSAGLASETSGSGSETAASQEAALLSQQAEAARRQVNMALLDTIGRHGRDDGLTAVLALRSQAQDLERRAQTAAVQPTAQPRMQPLAKQPTGKYEPDHPFQASLVKFAPNADRHGVATSDAVVHFVERVGELYGKPLTIGTGTNHHQYARPGHQSDHWTGHAADIPATGKQLIAIGRAALVAAGADPLWAAQQTGGLYRINNHQIIFNTDLGPNGGGNHHDHAHVSAY